MQTRIRLLSAALAIAAASSVAGSAEAAETPAPYPVPDTFLGEHLNPNEEMLAHRLATVIDETVRRQYQPGSARRDAHPKAHGCVRAEFRVNDIIDPRFAKGVFIPGKSYQAWVRFSNGNPDPNKPDTDGMERGMSIKLLGVPGTKILESEREDTTQDFLMMSHPVFFLRNASDAVPFFEEIGSESTLDKLKIPFTLGFGQFHTLLQINSLKIPNPLQTRYWTPTPYQLGIGPDRLAIKYSALPCTTSVDPMPHDPGPNFLREAMRHTLATSDACMNFMIQPRTSEKLDVEDARTLWSEADAPFYKVATVHIPKQEFDSPEQLAFCENLSFTPWHALPEHKPLGSINRLRRVVYERVSVTRHDLNKADRTEPQ
ncbi:MAG: catalase family protein [Steroidobacteraceae bacterium]